MKCKGYYITVIGKKSLRSSSIPKQDLERIIVTYQTKKILLLIILVRNRKVNRRRNSEMLI